VMIPVRIRLCLKNAVPKAMESNLNFLVLEPPLQNVKVERKFQTFFWRIKGMLNSEGLKDQLRSGVWAECALTVTFLSNLTSIRNQEIRPYQLPYGCKPRLPASLWSFGEI
jgi:hypothetical protein